MAVPQASMKKRQMIAHSSRTMFFWVAGMSAVVGICAVLSVFLFEQLMFKTQVTNGLDKTLGVIKQNNNVTSELIKNVQLRSTDSGLLAAKTPEEQQALQVVLDALPADENTLALGSSLQKNLIASVAGVTVESLSIDAPASDASVTTTTSTSTVTTTKATNTPQMPFSLTISASDPSMLKDILVKFEHSIRIIDIDSLILERSDTKYTMTIKAHAYYEPAQTVKLTDKTCTPKSKGC